MLSKMRTIVLLLLFQIGIPNVLSGCFLRDVGNDRKVCVCNRTTCDTIEAVKKVDQGQFLKYTSNRAGLRFEKESAEFTQKSYGKNRIIIRTNETRQKIFGFGGAFTDTTGMNVLALHEDLQKKFMRSYFSEEGIEYNIIRIPMGASDFSPRPYSYDDKVDYSLRKFRLAFEDHKYKIPFVDWAQNLTNNNIKLFASLWTAPKWLKTNNRYLGGRIKESLYSTYASYFVKFLDAYKKKGISFWGITTGNEPNNENSHHGIPAVEWTAEAQGKWLRNNLGPTLRKSHYSDIKILILDEGRRHLTRFTNVIFNDPEASKYADGVAVHWYDDKVIPVQVIADTHKNYSDKLILYTEASKGLQTARPIELGSWLRGEQYASSIIENTNNWVIGFVDWNMAVNVRGGPTYVGHPIDAAVLVNATSQEILKQPMFYAMGHFSKFVPRDSLNVFSSSFDENVPVAAYKRPDGGVAVVVVNKNDAPVAAVIEDANRGDIPVNLSAHSFTTIVYW